MSVEHIMRVMSARHSVVTKYCGDKGWDINNLTVEQIFEIRDTEEWKNPKLEQSGQTE